MAVRKFWKQMTMEADGFICVVNASEADDLSWMMIGQEVRMLREGRPVLLLLNRREAPERVCVSPKEALERLGLHETAGVQIEIIAASADVASADSGIAWLCDEVTNPLASRGASPFGTPPNSSPAQSPGPGRASRGADGHGRIAASTADDRRRRASDAAAAPVRFADARPAGLARCTGICERRAGSCARASAPPHGRAHPLDGGARDGTCRESLI